MNSDSLLPHGWPRVVERLGGAVRLSDIARETTAFQRPHAVRDAVSLLRLVLAYCLGSGGLRATAAWAAATDLADLSNPALLKRPGLRRHVSIRLKAPAGNNNGILKREGASPRSRRLKATIVHPFDQQSPQACLLVMPDALAIESKVRITRIAWILTRITPTR